MSAEHHERPERHTATKPGLTALDGRTRRLDRLSWQATGLSSVMVLTNRVAAANGRSWVRPTAGSLPTVGFYRWAGSLSPASSTREGGTTMTDANDETTEKARATYIVDRLEDVYGVVTAKRCDPIEGYDEDVGVRFEEIQITVEDGTTAATGLLDAYMASVRFSANGAAPSDHVDARRRTVCRTFVNRPAAEVYAIRSDDHITAGDATEEWAEEALFAAEDPRAE